MSVFFVLDHPPPLPKVLDSIFLQKEVTNRMMMRYKIGNQPNQKSLWKLTTMPQYESTYLAFANDLCNVIFIWCLTLLYVMSYVISCHVTSGMSCVLLYVMCHICCYMSCHMPCYVIMYYVMICHHIMQMLCNVMLSCQIMSWHDIWYML